MKIRNLLTASIILLVCSCTERAKPKQAALKTAPVSHKVHRDDALFTVTIDRKISGIHCTQGYILINGRAIGYTLELPDLNNTSYISSIPKDTYDAFIRTDGAKGWRIELKDVPRRPNIQIHVGNFTSDIEGCILVGKNVSLANCSVTPSIIKEVEKEFNAFTRDLVLNNANPQPVKILVEITGI